MRFPLAHVRRAKLPGIQKAVLYALWTWTTDTEGQYPFRSYAHLADDTGFSVPSVKRAVKGLRDRKLLHVIPGSSYKSKANSYMVNNQLLGAIAGVEPVSQRHTQPVSERHTGGITVIHHSLNNGEDEEQTCEKCGRSTVDREKHLQEAHFA